MILPFHEHTPKIHPTVFLAKGVVVSGDVEIDEYSNLWYNTVLRGDIAPTRIGKRVSVQDNSTLHQSPNNPLIIEDDVIIGHNAVLHSCTVRQGCLIGMGAIILDRAEIGHQTIVGAGTLIPRGKKIPAGVVIAGNPAKILRELNEDDYRELDRIVKSYVEKGQYYKELEATHL